MQTNDTNTSNDGLFKAKSLLRAVVSGVQFLYLNKLTNLTYKDRHAEYRALPFNFVDDFRSRFNVYCDAHLYNGKGSCAPILLANVLGHRSTQPNIW